MALEPEESWRGSLLFVLSLIAVSSVCGLTPSAAAQGLISLHAYFGALDKKPGDLPLSPLQLSYNEDLAVYAVTAPRSATGITLIAIVDRSSKVTVKRRNTPDGKKLKYKAWSKKRSRKNGSQRLNFLSFDGLGLGENTIQISVKNPERTKGYDVTVTRAVARGGDASLTALELSESGMTPAFASDTKSYEASVVYGVTALDVKVRRKEAATVIQLRGTASDGTTLAVKGMTVSGLTVGRNSIEVLATSEDGLTTRNYNIAAYRLEPSNDATLDDLTLLEGRTGIFGLDLFSKMGGGILRPAFSPPITSYEASVSSNVMAVKLGVTSQTLSALNQSGMAADGTPLAVRFASDQSISISGKTSRRRLLTFDGLRTGKNTIVIQATAEDGVTTETYKVTVTRDSAQ